MGNTNSSKPKKVAIHVAGPRNLAVLQWTQLFETKFPKNTLILPLDPTGPTESQWTKIREWETSPMANRYLLMVGSVDGDLCCRFNFKKVLVDKGQTLTELNQGYEVVKPSKLVAHIRDVFRNPNNYFDYPLTLD